MNNKVKAAIIQQSPLPLAITAGIEAAVGHVKDAVERGARIIAFGENFLGGHPSWLEHVPAPALWEFYMAYNLFRVSCIRQGVYARSLDGTASNVRAADSGKLVRPAAELGWQLVEGIAGDLR